MKKSIFFIALVLVFISCEKPSDCIESTGEIITKQVPVAPFKKIKVYRGIEVVITDGPETKVEIVAGENFIDNVQVRQNGDQLIFENETSCNWVRSYGRVKILVTTPTLEEVYSKTDRDISSNGALTFPYISFISMDKDGDGESGAGTGDFIINVNNDYLNIANNNVSRFYLTGQTNTAEFNFYFGDGRIEAENLTAQNVKVYHRGSNDMIVKPIQSIIGVMNSTGNIILKNVPPVVDVDELYQGRVIYP
ncbi:head GIN domain-containing protein [Flavobacterium terrisoli]|uniref:head GIN domain-containing protein n=1 Tax=Flavobacterium terrisoli TaxID=3242195 RepID=UPI002543AFB3|nr:head GIN domain-containing protein [Flavobacterium buctense]